MRETRLPAMISCLENWLLRAVTVDRYLPLQIDITNACNLRCRHCYHPHHRNEGALGLEQWFRILDEYDRMTERLRYRPFVILCGGEPLLSPWFRPILERLQCRSRPYRVSVLTNGTLLGKLDLELARGFQELSFQVSIDGPTAPEHDLVRGQGTFERARQGVRFLKSAHVRVHLLAVLSRRTATGIARFFALARDWDVDGMSFTRLIAQGEGAKLVDVGADGPLGPLALREAYREIVVQAARHGVRTSTDQPLMHLLDPDLGASGRFWEALVVDYQGRLLASSRSWLVLGDVLEEGLERLYLTHPLLRDLRRGRIAGCGPCPDVRRCGGDRNAAYAATGDFLGEDPGCWRKFQASEPAQASQKEAVCP